LVASQPSLLQPLHLLRKRRKINRKGKKQSCPRKRGEFGKFLRKSPEEVDRFQKEEAI